MNRAGKARQIARAVLVVGEGDSEVHFLKHLKANYVSRGSGVSVQIKNARGKGAMHVVDFAIRHSRNADYDLRVALLDADTDWNDRAFQMAKKGRIQVLVCQPCLEADLLRCHDVPVQGLSSSQLKARFLKAFELDASHPAVYSAHFPLHLLEAARERVDNLSTLLTLLVTGHMPP